MRRGGSIDDPLTLLAEIQGPAWLVGGALRDRLLGRATADFDVTVAGDPRAVAQQLARRISGYRFQLSEGFGAWRVISRDRSWSVDLLPLAAGSIEDDLARRDLTVNAIAQPLPHGELVDPFGGLRDLEANRLRMVSAHAFEADPLRTLRLARLACELDFGADAETLRAAGRSSPALARVAAERCFLELKRIISSENPVRGLRLLDELAATPVLLPELAALRGVGQSQFHHLDVYEHTLAVLGQTVELQRDPSSFLGAHAEAVAEFMNAPLANELTRWQALRFGALLHDIAKPRTRQVTEQGRVTFIGHDIAGSQTATEMLLRLRAGQRLAEHVAALARLHLRLGFLVHAAPLPRRAIYGYLRECDRVQIDVTVLSVADRLGTRGASSAEAIRKHLALAHQLLGEALAWIADPPRPPIRGDRLAAALGMRPGPELGRILNELEEAGFAGEVSSEDDAVARARELLRERSVASRR